MAIALLALLACSANGLKVEPGASADAAETKKKDKVFFSHLWGEAKARGKLELGNEKTVQWKSLAARRAGDIQALPQQSIIWYGDSLVEHWTGEGSGAPSKQYQSRPQLWQEMFTDRYGPSHASGIGGDKVGNLLWRLQHGEAPPKNAQPRVITLQIGINDIRDNFLRTELPDQQGADAIFKGYKAVVDELRQASPDSSILLQGINPASPNWGEGSRVSKIVPKLNRLIESLADNSKIRYVDCGKVFLKEDGKIDQDLLSGFLHPTTKGAKAWATCLQKPLDKMLTPHLQQEEMRKMLVQHQSEMLDETESQELGFSTV